LIDNEVENESILELYKRTQCAYKKKEKIQDEYPLQKLEY